MKLLILGNNPLGLSGLGRVSRQIVGICDASNVAYDYIHIEKSPKLKQLKNGILYSMEHIGESLHNMIVEDEYDFILTIGDIWNFTFISEITKKIMIPWVAYFGSEGLTYPTIIYKNLDHPINLEPIFESITEIWAYTEETVAAIVRTFVNLPKIEIFPHCYMLQDGESKISLKKQLGIKDKHKLCVFVGDNVRRKGLITFIEALGMKENREWFGYMHTPNFKINGIDLYQLRNVSELKGRLIFKNDLEILTHKNVFSDSDMIEIYKQADLFYHPHTAEGFGLCVLEALNNSPKTMATNTGGVKTFIHADNAIKPTAKNYEQYGGVGYMCESAPAIIFDDSKDSSCPIGYSVEQFTERFMQLITVPKEVKLWEKV